MHGLPQQSLGGTIAPLLTHFRPSTVYTSRWSHGAQSGANRAGQKRRTRTSRTMSDVLPMYFSEVQTPPACGPTVGLGTTLRQKVPGRAVRVTSARNVLGR